MRDSSLAPCLECGHETQPLSEVCVKCGGPILCTSLEGAQWGVDIGPIASQRFREETIDLLDSLLTGFSRGRTAKLLPDNRVRVVSGISRAAADALVQKLGTRKADAKAVEGPPAKLGLRGSFKYALPLLGLLGGIVAAIFTPAFLTIPAILGGIAAAVGLGIYNARRNQPLLGMAHIRPALPPGCSSAAERVAKLSPSLTDDDRRQLRQILDDSLAIMSRLTNPDDVAIVAAGGVDGGMARATTALLNQGIQIAESIVSNTDGDHDASRMGLQRLADRSQAARAELERLDSALSPDAETIERNLEQETEHVRQVVNELKQLS
jgi:hypothetical protein